MDLLLVYLITINAAGFFLMLADKKKAIRKKWRIPEAVLRSVCLAGGSLGILISMRLFRHKTLHVSFFAGVPVILCLQIILLITLLTLNI